MAAQSSVEAELGRGLGPVYAYAGYSLPRERGPGNWAAAYGGLEWRLGGGMLLTLVHEDARDTTSRVRDRQVTVQLSSVGTARRGRLFLARRFDDRADAWQAGVTWGWDF